MKRNFYSLSRRIFLLLFLMSSIRIATAQTKGAEEEFETGDFVKQRMEWLYQQRAYPLNRIPPGARLKALQQLDAKLAQEAAQRNADRSLAGTAVLSASSTSSAWRQIGPEPVNGYWGTASGRVAALAIDPRNSKVVYLGAAQGGVWKTTDGGTTWLPLTDSQASLAIGSIALDPSNPDTVYVGTGEENGSGDSYYGAGILKSTDGGTTWTQIPGNFVGGWGGGARIGGIAVDPSNSRIVLAAVGCCAPTNSGIYRSTDGGMTWSSVLNLGNDARDVMFDSTNGNVAYAAIDAHGIAKSTDGGLTWNPVNGSGTNALPSANVARVEMAMARSNTAVLYAGIVDNRYGSLLGFYKTTDGGQNWSQLTGTPNYCDGQCWYDNVIGVDPLDANVVYVGGAYSSPMMRSLDGGNTWMNVTTTSSLHPDSHALAFAPDASILYEGGDGGVASTTNIMASTVTWTKLNSTLAITQFYSGLSIHPTNVNIGFGGTQDNSTNHYTGSLGWQTVSCGDGGQTSIDFVNPNNVYVNCIGMSLEKSTDGGNNFVGALNGINTSDRVQWVPPLTMDPLNSQRLYFGTSRVYQTNNGAGTWTAISGDLTVNSLTTIAVAPSDPNTVYAGSGDSHLNVTTSAGSGTGAVWTDRSAGLPGRFISRIAVDAQSPAIAYVAFSGFNAAGGQPGHVFKTTNAGANWSDISGDLPDTPVNDIVADPDMPNTLYIGTDVGVFFTSNGGANWSTLGSGFPRVAVFGLALHRPTRTLRAATHGRSMWDLSLGGSACMTVTGASSWPSTTFTSQNGSFTATFDATPSASPINAVMGLSSGAQSAYTGYAAYVRFNPTGNIDARNGGSFTTSTITYSAGVTYHFRMVVNVPAHSYAAYVTAADGSEQTIGLNLAFRTEQNTVTSLDHMDDHAATGSVIICDFALGGGGTADFSLSALALSQPVTAGYSTSYTLTVTASNGFVGNVSLGASGLPAGASATFNPASVSSGSGSSTLTVSTSSSTAAGSYTLTVTGTSGSLSHTTNVTLVVSTSTPTCVTAGTSWQNSALAAQTGAFIVAFDATPSASPINSVVGLSKGVQTTYSGFATLARFNPSGDIDARNAGNYSALSVIPYAGGKSYRFRLAINVPGHTYSIYVTPPGGTEQTVGTNFLFRTEQNTVTSLDHWGVYAGTGSVTVCNFTIQ